MFAQIHAWKFLCVPVYIGVEAEVTKFNAYFNAQTKQV